MADLIELDLVVRDKGLKQSLTTVERLERQIVKAAKAVDQNRISQDRYNKVLLQAKREYQALGVSSQKATSQVRRFAEANREAARSAVANGDALGFAGKKINRMGVGLQQAGYQVGDFAVQIQGGTNAAVALGQQGAQLLGIFGPAGAIAGAALAITTAFIAPLLKAKDTVKELEDQTIKSIENIDKKLKATRLGVSEEELSFIDKLAVAQEKYNSALENFNSERAFLAGGEFSAKEMEELLLSDKQAMEQARVEASAASAAYEQFKASRTALLAGASLDAFGGEGDLAFSPEGIERAKEYSEYLVKIRGLMGEVSSETTTVTQKTLDLTSELGGSVEEAIALQKALDTGKISASQLSGVDIKAGISPAVAAAQELAKQLGISLRTALAMAGMIKKAGPVLDPRDPAYDADEANLQRLKDMVESGELYNSTLEKVTKSTKKLGKTAKKALSDAEKAAEAYAKSLDDQVIGAIGGVADAWGDFVVRGFSDFKGFVSSVLNSFKSMLSNMIAMAAKNKIMLSLGIGGVGSGSVASAAGSIGGTAGNSILSGGGMLSGTAVGAGISAIGTGLSSGFMSSVYGGFGGMSGAISGGLSVGGLGGVATAIGAIAAPLLAVAAVFSFFKKKTKELDNGLQGTITTLDATIESFKVIQTKRFWGLSKKVSTSAEALDAEAAQPLIDAITAIQQSAIDAAGSLGIASDVFDNFIYDLEISLKGLTEEEKIQKVNEELAKMGDEFASLTGIFSNMSELLAVAQQRYELEVQLLQVQGDVVELRRMELEAVHVLNRGLAARLQLLQAEGDLQGALGAFASGISQQQNLIRSAVDALVKPLQEAIDRTRSQAEKSYQVFRNAADKTRDEAENIVDIITGALDSRTIQSEAVERMRYTQAQQQLASFAGGASFDEASLRRATEGVSVDSTKFFGSFEDYARDFYKTQISLTKLADKAQDELTDVEKQIDVAEKAYQVAMGTYQETVDLNTAIETLAEDLNVYEATKLANEPLIKMVQDEGNRQIELLDSLLVETTKQVNALLGKETSMSDLVGTSVSIGEAMGVLGLEANSLSGGVLALGAIEKDIEGNVTDLGLYVVDLNGSVLKLDTGVFSLTDTVDALDGDITTLFESINLLDGGIDDFGLKVDELGVSTDDLGININDLGATLSNAMSGLGSIVSSLSGAVSGLAASNNALAAAQQAQAKASADAAAALAQAAKDAEINQLQEAGAGIKTGGNVIRDKSGNIVITYDDGTRSGPVSGSGSNSAALTAYYQVKDSEAKAEALRKQIEDLGGTPTFASGGMHSGGMRLVGEQGPELEVTGPSRIYSAQQTKNMLSGGSGEVVSELRSLRREVSEMKAEQRKIGVENVKYNKKSYDLNREWDIVGLPATRTS